MVMRPRYIFIAIAVIIFLIAILCAINREIGRRDGASSRICAKCKRAQSYTYSGVMVIVTPTPSALPGPWTVVCDKDGHYNFTDENGEVFPVEEWADYETALRYLWTIREMREKRSAPILAEERRRYDEIQSRQWEACPP